MRRTRKKRCAQSASGRSAVDVLGAEVSKGRIRGKVPANWQYWKTIRNLT
jgi:hypothetical protein